MFWKAVAVAVWLAAIGYYRKRRADYRRGGTELRPDARGTYVIHDRYSLFEKWGLRLAIVAGIPLVAWGVWDAYVFWTS